jgi:cytochrome P450
MFYHLALNPSIVSKARDEIKTLLSKDGSFDHREATHAEYINGIINEAMRLHPAVPSAIPRITPPEGLTVGETFIPGNTTVWCPQYTLGRCKFLFQLSTFRAMETDTQ